MVHVAPPITAVALCHYGPNKQVASYFSRLAAAKRLQGTPSDQYEHLRAEMLMDVDSREHDRVVRLFSYHTDPGVYATQSLSSTPPCHQGVLGCWYRYPITCYRGIQRDS